MIVNGFWFDNARLRILNGYIAPVLGAWHTVAQMEQLNESEAGIIVGMQQHSGSAAVSQVAWQITFDQQVVHQGMFLTDTSVLPLPTVHIGNLQPTMMPPVNMYVPPGVELGLRAMCIVAGGPRIYMDLYVVTFYHQVGTDLEVYGFDPARNPIVEVPK